jgi:penicillin-binding protein 1A
MSDDEHITPPRADPRAPIPFAPPRQRWRRDSRGRRRRPRIKKLRLLSIVLGLGLLALISTVFGMMMAVASDLPQIENREQFHKAANSFLYDDHWRLIGIFQGPQPEVIDTFDQLGTMLRKAIVAVEDKRFWTDPGVDVRGLLRAAVADIGGSATQGASTIAEQFVKGALQAEGNRTIFEKLREAALAYHLTQEWSRGKILREYLNSIYFGNGAYGAEAAARVYFGSVHGFNPADPSAAGCGDSTPGHPKPSCASELDAGEAALLAGMVANPTAFNPLTFPNAATARRDLVLQDMLQQGMITREQYNAGRNEPLPNSSTIERPEEPPAAPYFTSWLRPQILAAVGRGVPQSVAEYRAYDGGLKIRTTIDLPMQRAAEQAVSQDLPSTGADGVAASLVAIDNKTGQVRAMVGGPLINGAQDYNQYPFNLATEGERQPGSAFKPFTLAVGLEHGFGPSSIFDSKPLNLVVPNSGGKEIYHVKNFGNEYSGPISLASATVVSDNSVFTQLGLDVGTKNIKKMAKAMGIRTPVSTNYAMIIGGLKTGVTALDMAHAYETIADGGNRVYSPGLGAPSEGPIGIAQIQCPVVKCNGKTDIVAKPHYRRVISPSIAATIQTMLEGVVQSGTARNAEIPGVLVAGKTGTTSNYGDAWFVGWTPQLTCAVWVGYPNKLVPMTHLYQGGPVEGGTFPALIWRDFMSQAIQIYAAEGDDGTKKQTVSVSSPAPPVGGTGTQTSAGTGTTAGSGTGTTGGAGTGTTGGGTPTTGGGTGTTGGGTGTTGGGGGGTGTSGGVSLGG